MNLLSVVPGKRYQIVRIRDKKIRQQADCLGVGEGEDVYCCARQSDGPVLLTREGQLIAVGGKTARDIIVQPTKSSGH
ncbi:MAG: ferrous iron transport protein A [Firmicutes bacterium]|nr:ferrous iron transport protein A [Bacillota bacterium]